MNTVVVGTQWGDEGKGRVIDFLSREVDAIVRFQGGCNAGHTVVVEGKTFVFHLVLSLSRERLIIFFKELKGFWPSKQRGLLFPSFVQNCTS